MRSDKLSRILAALPKGARLAVCIDKATFHSNLEGDGVTVLDVESATVQTIEVADGDGFTDTRKDGTARTRCCLVLRGHA